MSTSIQEILAPLGDHWDRIIHRPMSKTELKALEKQVGLSAPQPLRDYLLHIGLFQDLTSWYEQPIEFYEKPDQFVLNRRFLADQLNPPRLNLFPFGDDGAGNVYALPPVVDGSCRIQFVDHETGKVKKQKEFTEWLEKLVAKTVKGIKRRLPNERKLWCVQFALRTTPFADLVALLATVGEVKEIDADWMNTETNYVEVTTSDRRIEWNGKTFGVNRSECAEWEGPMISFDMREPALTEPADSQIRLLDALFREKFPDYRLVDYGPLDAKGFEDNSS